MIMIMGSLKWNADADLILVRERKSDNMATMLSSPT